MYDLICLVQIRSLCLIQIYIFKTSINTLAKFQTVYNILLCAALIKNIIAPMV